MDEISVEQFAKQRSHYYLLDVREEWELEIASINPDYHIPLAKLPKEYQTLPNDRPIVVMCRSGGRSSDATAFLLKKGIKAKNLSGGILAWSNQIDSKVKKY